MGFEIGKNGYNPGIQDPGTAMTNSADYSTL